MTLYRLFSQSLHDFQVQGIMNLYGQFGRMGSCEGEPFGHKWS